MTIKNPVKLQYTIDNSDLNVVGEQLGYDWNDVCDEVGERQLEEDRKYWEEEQAAYERINSDWEDYYE